VKRLLGMVSDSQFGQVIISDTDAKRLENLLKDVTKDYQIIPLS